jgi:hydroxyacylglutathione hydrolase
MYFKHFYDKDIAQGAFLVGCQATGEAAVIDAHRDIQMFLDDAAANKLKIVAAFETHIHADYLSGIREIANATGATVYLSDEGDADWKYHYEGVKIYDGSEIKIGNITIRAVHTPGHTPEHMSYLITDGGFTSAPGYFLTGDFVFVGDIGRPDLLDEAAGAHDTRFLGSKLMFESLKKNFLNLPDYIQVWPGHGAGSACGKSLGAIASTTIGYERNFSWWGRMVEQGAYQDFESFLLSEQPDAPLYFARMKRMNKAGAPILGPLKALRHFSSAEIAAKVGKEILFIDSRPMDIFRREGVENAYNIPWNSKFLTYASWVIDPEVDKRGIVLFAASAQEADQMRRMLIRVGIDQTIGFVTEVDGLKKAQVKLVGPETLNDMKDAYILDIRALTEYNDGHIPGAHQLHGGRVMWNLDKLPKDRPLVTHCKAGPRNTVVSSALRSAGFDNVIELNGGYDAWAEAHAVAHT